MVERVVLVTGAGGFLADALLPHVRAAWPAARLVGLGRRAAPPGEQAAEQLDLNDAPALHAALERLQPDIVLHAAGRLGGDWPALYRDNVQATLGLLDALHATVPAARTVIVGSAAECGMVTREQLPLREDQALNPVTPYGVSKAWQSLAARSCAFRGQPVTVARIFNVVGPGMPGNTSLGTFALQLREIAAGRRAPALQVGNLETRRDFVAIADIAAALCALAQSGRSGEIYNVCTGRSVAIREALDGLVRACGLDVRIDTEAARLRPADVPEVYGSFDKIAAHCGWSPRVPLEDSLAAMVAA